MCNIPSRFIIVSEDGTEFLVTKIVQPSADLPVLITSEGYHVNYKSDKDYEVICNTKCIPCQVK